MCITGRFKRTIASKSNNYCYFRRYCLTATNAECVAIRVRERARVTKFRGDSQVYIVVAGVPRRGSILYAMGNNWCNLFRVAEAIDGARAGDHLFAAPRRQASRCCCYCCYNKMSRIKTGARVKKKKMSSLV